MTEKKYFLERFQYVTGFLILVTTISTSLAIWYGNIKDTPGPQSNILTTEKFQSTLQGCASGAKIEITADLLGSIKTIYEGDKTKGTALISSQSEFLKLIPKEDRLQAYKLYTTCISNIIKQN